MVSSLNLPVLSLAVPNIHKLNNINAENISSMWSVFSKCKDNLENGRRLENLSWRLWFRESMMVNEKGARKETDTTTALTLSSMTTAEHVRTPIPICTTSINSSPCQQNDEKTQDYFEPTSSAGSSMKDSAISGCGRSVKRLSASSFKRMVSSLGSDHPVEEARRAYEEEQSSSSASKPTAEAARLSNATTAAAVDDAAAPTKIREQDKAVASVAHDSSFQPQSHNSSKFYIKEKNVVSETIDDHDENLLDDDDDTCSEWSAQDDETVFADDANDDHDDDFNDGDRSTIPTNSTHQEFRKQVPKNDDLPKKSLLSIMLKKQDQGFSSQQQQQQRNKVRNYHQQLAQGIQRGASTMRSSHTRPIHHQHHYNHRKSAAPVGTSRAGRIQHCANTGDLSESLQFCVDWERRQNVSPPVAILQRQQQRRLSTCVTSRATATCTTTTTATAAVTSWFESFRGW